VRQNKKKVLAIEVAKDLADLVQMILAEVGYDVTAIVCGPSAMDTAKTINPDVILLDLGYHAQSCGWDVLRKLRSDKDTQGIPLLVISDTEQLLDDAKRSFNVRQELLKPYDIDDVEKGIAAAVAGVPLLPHPAPAPTTGPLSALAAAAISREADAIMAQWLRRVQKERIVGPPGAIPLRVLMENSSVWLVGLVSVLRYGPEKISGREEIRDKLVAYIREARQRGITLPQVIKQFEILRDEAWSALERATLEPLTTADVFALGRALNTAVDEVLAQIASVYASLPGAPKPSRATTA
jgi:CheY-like chemotaxis protein